MVDHIGAGKPAYTRLQAAFDRARALNQQRKQMESSHITHTIRRHKLVPALTPTGQLRRQPDREAFQYYEALDRKEAIQRRKERENNVDLSKKHNKDHETEK